MTFPAITIDPTDSVAHAEETMNREKIGHLPVTDGDVLVGVVSRQDVLDASPPSISIPSEDDEIEYKAKLHVCKIMRGVVETVRPGTDAAEAAGKLLDLKIGCLPVIDERFHVVGIVTTSDYVRLARDLLIHGHLEETGVVRP
ncbi:CBS domain-containing protein [Sorangium sp. So ce321]|uniref:CBS domain-containing protein n=1 Tax=Sorangium sp. So ce321 TaxID=3133300 RepID=UPI003F634BC8